MNPKSQDGHSSLTVFVTILLISTMLISAISVVRPELSVIRKYASEYNGKTASLEIMDEIIVKFQEDPTPDSHSLSDPVWEYISQKQSDGLEIKLKDISSRLNPNWMRTKLFEETDLSRLIISGESPDDIRNKRNEEGFVSELESWVNTFGEENLSKYFTLYSWANINVTYEESLESLYRLRYGDNGASVFRKRIQEGLKESKLWPEDELSLLMGMAADTLYPVINTLPLMNIHFIDPFILESILSYPYQEKSLPNPAGTTRTIIDARKISEISPVRLKHLINPEPEQMRVLEYLGTQTWFWEVSISINDTQQVYIIEFNDENWVYYLISNGILI